MQSTPSGVGSGGLSRFSSAPTTWLEALLEDEQDDPLKPNHCLSHLLANESDSPCARNSNAYAAAPAMLDAASGGSAMGFLRQNSSPAEFSGVGSDEYFQTFGVPASYDYISPVDVPPGGKRGREEDPRHSSRRFSLKLEGEQSSQLPGAMAGLLDMDMEKMFEDSVPCRVRAKRGCATHPRSIAERVRRTRISDRIRKLQELVPNMDKQTNTADMLEEAVEYVKLLQKQIKELSEHQRKCTCLVKEVKEEGVRNNYYSTD